MKCHIFLIGFMGVGKSTVSRQLKNKLRADEVDMDQRIVREEGMSINEMFERFGETYFREKETMLLKRLADEEPAIVSCGGGTAVRPENVALMKKCGKIVLLTATPETVYERVRYGKERPLLKGHMNVAYIAQLMETRRNAYESACDLKVSTDGKSPGEIAEEIIRLIVSAKNR